MSTGTIESNVAGPNEHSIQIRSEPAKVLLQYDTQHRRTQKIHRPQCCFCLWWWYYAERWWWLWWWYFCVLFAWMLAAFAFAVDDDDEKSTLCFLCKRRSINIYIYYIVYMLTLLADYASQHDDDPYWSINCLHSTTHLWLSLSNNLLLCFYKFQIGGWKWINSKRIQFLLN